MTGVLKHLCYSAGAYAQHNEPRGGGPMRVPKCIEPRPDTAFNTRIVISAGVAPRIAATALRHRRLPIAEGAACMVLLQVFV